jgi:tetrahydromethanopterin S-methyltransferase subunit H
MNDDSGLIFMKEGTALDNFGCEQKIYQIGNVRIGGQPGERATVLCGSIFFRGHKIVKDNLSGAFDKDAALALLDEEAAISAETGNPCIVDVIGDTGEALARHAEFVLEKTTHPILFDSLTPKARIEALELLRPDADVAERIIYNSLDPNSPVEELEAISKHGIRSAVLLAFDKLSLMPDARLKLLTEPGGLLDKASQAGIQHCLVDPGVLDVPSLAWTVITIGKVKEQLGLPGGCAPSNSVYLWKKMRAKGSPVFESVAGVVFNYPVINGADFLLYGPIGNARWVYPAVATADAIMAYGKRALGVRIRDREHPLFKIFKD